MIPRGGSFPIYHGNRKPPQYLTKEEIHEILDTIPKTEYRDYVLILTLWGTGFRVSETIRIRKRDINFAHRTMRVTWLKKRRVAERIIPIHQDLAAQLAQYTANMKYDDLIFDITRQRVGQICKKYGNQTTIKKRIHPHIFRHSFAVNFLKATRDIMALSRLLGHSSVGDTMIYLQLTNDDLADRLAEMTL